MKKYAKCHTCGKLIEGVSSPDFEGIIRDAFFAGWDTAIRNVLKDRTHKVFQIEYIVLRELVHTMKVISQKYHLSEKKDDIN